MVSVAYKVAHDPSLLKDFTPDELKALEYSWAFWARPNQLEPEPFEKGEALIWLLLAGRGFGKSRCGAETIRKRVNNGTVKHIGLVAPTAADARDIMVLGQSGVVSISSQNDKAGLPTFMPSRRKVVWPNGAQATIYSAEDPDQLRGPQHDFVWCDELAAWPRLTQQACWDNLQFGLREGASQCIITTTPRPIPLLRNIIKRTTTYITKGSTYDNLENLSQSFRANVVEQYAGTRLGRQELNAEILEDSPGALWTYNLIEQSRIAPSDFDINSLKRIVVAIDPSGSSQGHECGIMVGGIGYNEEGYLLADYSLTASPQQWAERAIFAYDTWLADRIVVETNFGAEMVRQTLNFARQGLPITEVRASQGKRIRAEPVAALYEQGKIHHVGTFETLEAQQTGWLPEDGPNDRLDALVWLMTELKPNRPKASIWYIGSAND